MRLDGKYFLRLQDRGRYWRAFLPKAVFGWGDLGRKEREGKEIRGKGIYLSCLVVGKIGMKMLNSAQISMEPT